jgi:hypothetical protein
MSGGDKDTSACMVAGHELDSELGEQQWLFRQGDLVLGPLTGQQLVEKLYTGELSADTLVAPPGARDFTRIGDVEAFKVHVARALAKAKVDAELRLQRQRTLKKRLIIGSVAGVAGLIAVLVVVNLARRAAVYGPGGEEDEFAGITMELPTITLAKASRVEEEELIDYPSASPTPAPRPPDKPATATAEPKPKPPPGTSTPGTTAPSTPASAVAARTEKKPPSGTVSSEPDGLQMGVEFDQANIDRVVKGNQKTLFRCLKEEAERRPGFAAKVPIEFVIGNDGKVSKLWVDHPQLKQGPLHDCLLGELRKWAFKPYKGQLASVQLAFTVGSKG